MIGSWYTYQAGQARNRAISVPAISRSRDLMASVLASMELEMCTEIWNGNEMETVPLAPRTWLKQLDPEMPNSFLFPWVFDDLILFWPLLFVYHQPHKRRLHGQRHPFAPGQY
jgi:hypothetical protein